MNGPLWRMSAVARPQAGRLALAALLGALALGCAVGLTATSAFLISKAALQPPILHLQVAIVGVRAFGIGRGVFRYAERVVGHDAAFRSLAGLRVQMYGHLQRQAPAGLGGWRRGDLLTRLVADVDAALDLQLRFVLPALATVIVGVASVVLAWFLLPVAGLMLLIGLALAGIVAPLVGHLAGGAAERRTAPARGTLAGELVTTLESAADLIALQADAAAIARIARADARATDLARRAAYAGGASGALVVAAQGLVVVGSLVAGSAAVRAGDLEGVLLAVVVLLPLAAFEGVAGMPGAVRTLARVRSSARRVFEVVDSADPSPDPVDPVALPDPPPAGVPLIEARGLTLSWPGSRTPALRGADLCVAPRERVALVGPSGAGKSTLAAALLKFIPVASGSLRIHGVAIEDLAGDDVRAHIGLLTQDAHVFQTSIAENVRLARPGCSDAEVRDALARACLLPWVEGLPDGIHTVVAGHGASMSGGQRQRLALSRILLAGHPTVILDEPTEHLDDDTAQAVLDEALIALAGRTVLLITHQPSFAARMDRVVEIVPGSRTREDGPDGH